MKTSAAVATALLLSLPQLATAASTAAADARSPFERRCEGEMLPVLEVSSHEAGVQVSNAVSSRVLNNRGSHNVAGELMLGMTSSKTRAEIDLGGISLRDPAGSRECIAPRVSIELSFEPMEVFVAREFHPVSCSYRTVFAHEMRHVQLFREQLPRLEAVIRDELARRYVGQPLYAPVGRGLAMLQDQIDGWLAPFIKAELAKVDLLQVALDSHEESFRLSHSCQGEVASTLGSSL